MSRKELTTQERREWQEWLIEKKAIINAKPIENETPEAQQRRIKYLLKDPVKFGHYYFPHLVTSEFGYFQKRDMLYCLNHPDCMMGAEWPREHAKSIIWDVIMPLMLKARGELTGMMIGSANEDKANILLSDIQAELMLNERFTRDFGEQRTIGQWKDGYFVTSDGVGFWAFGRGQSPRGTRKGANRPNYGVIDDIDDAGIVKSLERVLLAVDWVLGDFFGAMQNKGSRLIIAGNRIHKYSILAHLMGDVNPDDPIRNDLYHSKIFALENPKTHAKDLSEDGVPAWKENYTREQILAKMNKQGNRIGLREFFHEHVIIGRVFKEADLPWVKVLDLSQYDELITYCDPSYKDTKFSDGKGIALIGRKGRYYDIIKAFNRQCKTGKMVAGHYNIADLIPENLACRHWMESNFMQDLMLEEYYQEGDRRGYYLRIRGDDRKKPEKTSRIENLSPLTDQRYIRFNQDEKHDPDMQLTRDQFLGFPDLEHDEGPDMVEGGIWKLTKSLKHGKSEGKTIASGGYTSNSSRRM